MIDTLEEDTENTEDVTKSALDMIYTLNRDHSDNSIKAMDDGAKVYSVGFGGQCDEKTFYKNGGHESNDIEL